MVFHPSGRIRFGEIPRRRSDGFPPKREECSKAEGEVAKEGRVGCSSRTVEKSESAGDVTRKTVVTDRKGVVTPVD